jgi:hypothetical protein
MMGIFLPGRILIPGTSAKFQNPGNPFWKKSNKMKEKKEREKSAINSGHYVLPATPNSTARTPFRPIMHYLRDTL